jgi:molybdopterin-binding protein
MKTTVFSVLLLVFTVNFIVAFAQEQTDSDKVNWVSGVIESIQSGKDNSLISVIMQNGEIFNFSSTNDKMEGIQVGDSISAKVAKGWAQSVQRLGKPVEIAKPKKDSEGYQWVSGEITAIRTGKANSLVSVKMQNGENFNFSATNQIVHGIMVGDRVRARVYKGWAESIATNGGHF